MGDLKFWTIFFGQLPLINPLDSLKDQADVVHYGIQEGTTEGLLYSGVFVESMTTLPEVPVPYGFCSEAATRVIASCVVNGTTIPMCTQRSYTNASWRQQIRSSSIMPLQESERNEGFSWSWCQLTSSRSPPPPKKKKIRMRKVGGSNMPDSTFNSCLNSESTPNQPQINLFYY